MSGDNHSSSVTLELTDEEALVLFDWLARSTGGKPAAFVDQAEQRVLWDIESMLESVLLAPISPDYNSQLAAARETVRDPDIDGIVRARRTQSGGGGSGARRRWERIGVWRAHRSRRQ